MNYGLISTTDGKTLEKTIDLILQEFPNDNCIFITEVGLFNCQTIKGLKNYILSEGRACVPIGIDNEKDKTIKDFEWLNFIKGNSNDVYYKLEDNSQHLIFIDASHRKADAIADYFCYRSKVKKGGYIAFHDTGKHIKPFKDFQSGDPNNPDNYISVREALSEIGLFKRDFPNWELVFDEADESDEAGGVCVFKKVSLISQERKYYEMLMELK